MKKTRLLGIVTLALMLSVFRADVFGLSCFTFGPFWRCTETGHIWWCDQHSENDLLLWCQDICETEGMVVLTVDCQHGDGQDTGYCECMLTGG